MTDTDLRIAPMADGPLNRGSVPGFEPETAAAGGQGAGKPPDGSRSDGPLPASGLSTDRRATDGIHTNTAPAGRRGAHGAPVERPGRAQGGGGDMGVAHVPLAGIAVGRPAAVRSAARTDTGRGERGTPPATSLGVHRDGRARPAEGGVTSRVGGRVSSGLISQPKVGSSPAPATSPLVDPTCRHDVLPGSPCCRLCGQVVVRATVLEVSDTSTPERCTDGYHHSVIVDSATRAHCGRCEWEVAA